MKHLILGGARSGKSQFAEKQAQESDQDVICIVTAQAKDDEMAERIRLHRERRPIHWQLIEEPILLATTLKAHAAPERCLLIDCLSLWLSNLLHANENGQGPLADTILIRERQALLTTLPHLAGRIILVSNEVGMGIVPVGELSRRFCDEIGRLHQDLARMCDTVTFMVAGLPLSIKGKST
ncbi:MAG: bifunctional adenosylcobinamide kinase/adenosylcobinamide-phosphate guanylyltransferase [Gammaproteobacteria bacterium]|nr:bifunctional adenosylcobinamide kinase/adenosylcobinamide-phosphate guanylyltransferase [Gammaproteobacteria bacterium]